MITWNVYGLRLIPERAADGTWTDRPERRLLGQVRAPDKLQAERTARARWRRRGLEVHSAINDQVQAEEESAIGRVLGRLRQRFGG